ncbi:MAG: Outer rane vitamin receptor BtuB [Myxococcales bacterium]|nr:Outer rane vitamin receptor BtuB [Myxococcales bacterium]
MRNIEELDLEQLLGKVTAASRTEESVLTAPATVTVLDKEQIRQSAATTLPDLLRNVAGVQVLELAAGDFLVSLRGTGGLTGNNVVVLLDGIPLNSRIDGNVDWGAIPIDLEQIDRIEIVRGPVSTIYGPDAYTGVINIVSIAPAEGASKVLAHIGAGVDSAGRAVGSAAASVSGTRGKFSGRLSLNGRYDNTFAAGSGTPAWGLGGGTAFLQYAATPTTTISLELGGSFSRRSSLDHLVLDSLPQDNTQVFGAVRVVMRELSPVVESLEIWERVRALTIDSRQSFTGFTYRGANSGDEELGADVRLVFPHHFKLALGGNGGIEYVDAPFLHPQETGRLRPRYGFYADAGLELWNHVSLAAAVRGDASAVSNGLQFAGRGSIIYHAAKYALRLTAGTAYRDPTYVEVASRFVDPATNLILIEGTPGLNPPRITSIELGAIVAPMSKLTIKPTVFTSQLSNLMVEDFQPLVRRTFENEKQSRWILGAELEATYQALRQLIIEANVTGLFWLSYAGDISPTVGNPDQNSTISAWLGARSTLVDGRLTLSLGAGYNSPRHYNLRAGIPPLLLSTVVDHEARVEGAASYQLTRRIPLWLSLKVRSNLPHDHVESPLPGTSVLGTVIFVALDYR